MLGFVTQDVELKSKSLPSRSSQAGEEIVRPTVTSWYAFPSQNMLGAMVRLHGESE